MDGHVYSVGRVNFVLPPTPQRQAKEEWHVHTVPSELSAPSYDTDGVVVSVDLHFIPIGTREEHLNALVIVSDFVQPYGHFTGTITLSGKSHPKRVLQLDHVFGVVENHHAKW